LRLRAEAPDTVPQTPTPHRLHYGVVQIDWVVQVEKINSLKASAAKLFCFDDYPDKASKDRLSQGEYVSFPERLDRIVREAGERVSLGSLRQGDQELAEYLQRTDPSLVEEIRGFSKSPKVCPHCHGSLDFR
jgi:hypothetical protein